MKNLVKRMKRQTSIGLIVLGLTSLLMTSCSDEDVKREANKASIYATDAPIDNAEVKAVFVTVSELKVDGKKVEGFQKTTLEVSALTEGKTQLLNDAEVDASSVNELTVVLDYEMDANGNSPGSYVLKLDGSKDAIASNETELTFTKNLDISSSGSNDIVIDFDLRKMIKEEAQGNFELVSSSELESSIRIVSSAKTGTVEGRIDSSSKVEGKAVAYLYSKGTFDLTELKGQGESNIEFKNAVNSAEVSSDGTFKIAFAEEGEYEIHIFEYTDSNNDGKMEIKGKLELKLMGGADLGGFTVGANNKTDLDIGIKSIFPL